MENEKKEVYWYEPFHAYKMKDGTIEIFHKDAWIRSTDKLSTAKFIIDNLAKGEQNGKEYMDNSTLYEERGLFYLKTPSAGGHSLEKIGGQRKKAQEAFQLMKLGAEITTNKMAEGGNTEGEKWPNWSGTKATFSLSSTNDKLEEMVIGEDWSPDKFDDHFTNKGYKKVRDNSLVGFYFVKPGGQTFQLVPSFHKKGEIIKYAEGGNIGSGSLNPREYFKSLNLTKLPQPSAAFIDTQILSDPDIDLLEPDDEDFEAVKDLISQDFPEAISPGGEEESPKPSGAESDEAQVGGEKAEWTDAIDTLKMLIEAGGYKQDLAEWKDAVETLEMLLES